MDENVNHFPSDAPRNESESVESESFRQFALLVLSAQRDVSPLPHPRILQGYEDIQHGTAERLLRMTEKEQEHRHELESAVVTDTRNLRQRGQIFGFLIGMACLVSGTLIALDGHAIEGTHLSGATIVSLVSVFVFGSRQQSVRQDEDTDS